MALRFTPTGNLLFVSLARESLLAITAGLRSTPWHCRRNRVQRFNNAASQPRPQQQGVKENTPAPNFAILYKLLQIWHFDSGNEYIFRLRLVKQGILYAV
jgi:hypothetical protein